MDTPVIVLVAGPSGAGKDTLLAAARAHFADDSRYSFTRRVITRPAGKDEDNRCVTEEEFVQLENENAFIASWRAHGNAYGILAEDLTAEVNILSVSRTVIGTLWRAHPRVHVVEITARRDVLRERLARRGRETADEIEQRLNRYMPVTEASPFIIDNSGDKDTAVYLFCRYLETLPAPVPL